MGSSSVQTWWWQAGTSRPRRRQGMIVFRSRNGRRERRAGIDFDPLQQSFDDVIASMAGQVTPARETDDSVEILVHIGDAPLLMSRESDDWPRLARLGS